MTSRNLFNEIVEGMEALKGMRKGEMVCLLAQSRVGKSMLDCPYMNYIVNKQHKTFFRSKS